MGPLAMDPEHIHQLRQEATAASLGAARLLLPGPVGIP